MSSAPLLLVRSLTSSNCCSRVSFTRSTVSLHSEANFSQKLRSEQCCSSILVHMIFVYSEEKTICMMLKKFSIEWENSSSQMARTRFPEKISKTGRPGRCRTRAAGRGFALGSMRPKTTPQRLPPSAPQNTRICARCRAMDAGPILADA